jgi:hypothetical protein
MACMAQRELMWPPQCHAENTNGKRKPGPVVRQASAAPKPVPPPGKRPGGKKGTGQVTEWTLV